MSAPEGRPVILGGGVAIDVQGNFHRGLMLGVLLGFALGLGTVGAAAATLLALR